MIEIDKKYSLFSFILACYKEIYSCNFYDINPIKLSLNLQSLINGKPSLNFEYFYECLKKDAILEKLENKRLISELLIWLDSNIYYFNEYQQLAAEVDNSKDLEDDVHYLVIQSSNSIAKRLNLDLSIKDNKGYGLRNKKIFDPLKNFNRIGLKNLVFVTKEKGFKVTQKFINMKNLSDDLNEGVINISFYPTIHLEKENEIFKTLEHDEERSFSIEYCYKTDKYLNTFKGAINSKSDIVLFPECVCEKKALEQIQKLLKSVSSDISQLYVTGSTWNNNSNICYVYDENGNELVKQEKVVPYYYKKTDEQSSYLIYEKLENKVIEITLLHILNYGIVGFPICSDLNSSRYIESIYCECGVDMLIFPCFSKSDDIFSSLAMLSMNYWITVIACNGCLKAKKLAYVYIPYKKKTKRTYIEYTENCKKIGKCDVCKGLKIKIDIKKLTK